MCDCVCVCVFVWRAERREISCCIINFNEAAKICPTKRTNWAMQLILKKIQIFLNKGSMRLIKKTYYTNWCFFNLPRSHQLNFDWHKKWPFNKLWHFEAPYTMFDLFFCAVKGFFLDVSTVFWMFYVFFGYLWMFWDVLSLFGGCGGMSLEQLTQTLIGCKPQRLGWMARDWKFDFQLESRYSLNVFLWIGKPRKIEIIISRPL